MPEKIVLEGFKPYVGKHCETTALKRVLGYHGLSLSEEMLLGLGGGISFIYWYMKMMPSPFIGGRYGKGPDFPKDICRRISGSTTVMETGSAKKGYEELKALLRAGEPAVVYGDMVYLPYLTIPEVAHFGGHVFVVFGIDEANDEVHIYDIGINPVTVTLTDLARARGSKFPPFPPKHRLLKIDYPKEIGNLKEDIKESIRECYQNMLKPPIKNIGLLGLEKWSKIVVKWPQQFSGINLLGALMNGFIYIETGGTGGSAFRKMYAQFLEEASSIINQPALREIARMIRESAVVWREIAYKLMPDSWPNLKRMRELIVEKNELFKHKPGETQPMMVINEEMDILMEKAIQDLEKIPEFLPDVQQSILKCLQIEKQAFQELSQII